MRKRVSCRQVRRRLSTFCDGELEHGDTTVMKHHLESCASCDAVWESFTRLTQVTEEMRHTPIPEQHQHQATRRVAHLMASTRMPRAETRLSWARRVLAQPNPWAIAIVGMLLVVVALVLVALQENGAYAEVKLALNNARDSRYIHSIGKLDETWMEQGRRSITDNRLDIILRDYETAKVYRYDKELKKVYVYGSPTPTTEQASDSLFDQFKRWVETSDHWSKTEGAFKGTPADLYQASRSVALEDNPMQLQCWIDPVRQRVLRVEWNVEGSEDEELNANWREFDYPEQIPQSLYEVGVPPETPFIDFKNSPEADHILEAYAQARNLWNPYRLVVLQENVSEGTQAVQVSYHSGDRHRWENYPVPRSSALPEPVKTLQDAETIMKGYYPYLTSITRNGQVTEYDAARDSLSTHYGSGWDFFRRYALRNFTTSKGSPRHLTEIAGEEQRDGERLIKVQQHYVERYHLNAKTETVFISTTFWLNPSKDYLIHRAEGANHDATPSGMVTHSWQTQVERYAQTPDGIWYPAVVVAHDQEWGGTEMSEKRFSVLALETDVDFPDSLFPSERAFRASLASGDGRKPIFQQQPSTP